MSAASPIRNLPTKHESDFTKYLVSLLGSGENETSATPNRAALASLRRGLGKTPGESADMFPYVIPWFSDEMSEYRQNDFFLVASLFALHQGRYGPHPTVSDPRRNSLGASFIVLFERTKSDSIEKRFVALLNASREEVDEHLRHAISLLKAHNVGVDWAQLLHDLNGWGYASRSTQRRWAQGYWQTRTSLESSASADPTTSSTPDTNE